MVSYVQYRKKPKSFANSPNNHPFSSGLIHLLHYTDRHRNEEWYYNGEIFRMSDLSHMYIYIDDI